MFRRFLAFLKFAPAAHDPLFTVPRESHAPWQSEAANELVPLARMLVVVKPKQPYVDWLKKNGHTDDSLKEIRRSDSISFLIPTVDWEIEEAEAFVEKYWTHFFAQMLSMWELNQNAWPKQRTQALFQQWFEVDTVDQVLDLGRYAE
jgi:hypothetical protein